MRWVVLAALGLSCGDDSSHGGIVGMTIDPPTARVEQRKTQQFRALAMYGDHSAVDVTQTAQWSIADPTIGQVEKGLMTGFAAGASTVTVTYHSAQTSAAVSVPGARVISDTPLWTPPDSQTSVGDQVLATDEEGRAMLATSITGPSPKLITWSYDGDWHQADVGAMDFLGSSDVSIELALGPTGAAGLAYGATDGSTSFMRYGVALYDGTWHLLGVHAGTIFPVQAVVTPSIAMDNQPTLFVAYATLQQTLGVSRFDVHGLLNETIFPEAVGIMPSPQVAANGVGQVMVLATVSGSHIFDGFNWGPLAAFPDNVQPPGLLKFADDGTAQFINLGLQPAAHYRFTGGAWSPGFQLATQGSGSPLVNAAAAIDRQGRAVDLYGVFSGATGSIMARTFDGTSWTAPLQLNTDSVYEDPIYVFTNGAGHFVAMWSGSYEYFDGAWRAPVFIEGSRTMAMLSDGRLIIVGGGLGGVSLHAQILDLIP
jgi:hypothetical protein